MSRLFWLQLKQLERLRSEDNPHPPNPQNKTKSKFEI